MVPSIPQGTSRGVDNASPTNGVQDNEKLKQDIRSFVDNIFTDSQSISLEKKAEFGLLVRTPEARLLFAIFVDEYRVNIKSVSELTFYSLAQYFSIVLFECLVAEDFRPAKIIMNMMFTYYYEHNCETVPFSDEQNTSCQNEQLPDSPTKSSRTYLYTLLKDQKIFKSIRFWTSAFYESVISERKNHSIFHDKDRGKLSNERRDEELDCSKNITFGLLGTFIHNMIQLDLSHEFCREFLDKHSTIADLTDEQLEMLRSNMARLFNETSGSTSTSSSLKKSERLALFLQRIGSKLN